MHLESNTAVGIPANKSKPGFIKNMVTHPWLYVFITPLIIYLFIFNYIPIYGLVMAFQNFDFGKGFFGSPWVGLEHFKNLMGSSAFWDVFRNSIILSLMRLVFGFPAPVFLAILLNEVRSNKYKRFSQTVVYLPHFISWVIIAGMAFNLLSTSDGLVNVFIKSLGMESVKFLDSSKNFRWTLIGIEVWKEVGWGTIVYLASITGIDPELYEAAKVDGAGRIKRIIYITIPCISGTIAVLLILRMGQILNNGFEQIFLLYNPMVYDVADVLETYSYRMGILEGRFSYTTAMGLFKSIIAFILIMLSNNASKKLGSSTLF